MFKFCLDIIKISFASFNIGTSMSMVYEYFVKKGKYITKKEFDNLILIINSIPGPILPRMVITIGYRSYGLLGAFIAAIFACLPLIGFFLIFMHYADLNESTIIKLQKGILPVSVALIVAFTIQNMRKHLKDLNNNISKFVYFTVLVIVTIALFYKINILIILCVLILFIVILYKKTRWLDRIYTKGKDS